ncbi:50S ribosomal protein L4 [Candidatus Woesearchaeota archaeon]|nr:50S ribosomal protein L4 [Candidatus Woesearchaeota archaeon]MBI2130916.1 50S ribosomal protein L4 [Candidatus Woesearchaeota archaeon]MBI2660976.1 50S ribosomal protein L4 [Candidatus Woesearchaeota archaeon]
MKVDILDISNNKVGQLELPVQFMEEIRQDLIARAVLAQQSEARQIYGANPHAGKRASAVLSRRRRKYRGSYGIGIARSPRKIMTRSGTRFNWVGAFAPNTVGGRRAHPPKATKDLAKRINRKEKKKAIRSAISATMVSELVAKRGHVLPEKFPFIVDDKIEGVGKTGEVFEILTRLGFGSELERGEGRKIRAGRGKLRGRKYKRKRSLLIVVSKPGNLMNAAHNIPGIDIVGIKSLNAELLAPGAVPGRLTLWTKSAVEQLRAEKSFLN